MKLLHQCGHNTSWNVQSFTEHGAGDGLLFSPVHYKKNEIERLDATIRSRALFDPQFYLPNSQKTKLKTYPFFPEVIADGYSTQSYEAHALDAARQCVEFQVENGFEGIVIPAKHFEQMDPNYIEKQEAYTVVPFLQSIESMGTKKKVFLTLPTTIHMILNQTYRTQLLNWVTKFPEIHGVYLFTTCESESKQICDKNMLFSYLEFVRELNAADLEVIVGYLNTEGLLFSLINGVTITMGSFENTRMFSLDKFIVTDEDRRGPKARIFMPGLLNWIEFGQAKTIREMSPDLWKKIHVPTTHSEPVLDAAVEPTFNQSPLYMHHFVTYAGIVKEFNGKSPGERHSILRAKIKSAMECYQEIHDLPFDLERHGTNAHLQPWLDAVNQYFSKFLKS